MLLVAAESQGGSSWSIVIMFALLFGLMYFMFIRPQSKRRKEAAALQKQLGPGDKVVTIGGLYGTVTDTDDDSVTLEISPGVTARYARQAVARVLERVSVPADDADDSAEEPVSPIQETKKPA